MNRRNLLRTSTRLLAGTVSALAASVLAAGGATAAPSPVAGPAPVPSLDLDRYLGTWRQLAAVPQFFNLACARDTQANYSLDPQGNIAVRNTCTTWANTRNEINGTATVTDQETRAQLHVSFPGVPTQDRLEGATNYIVTALGPDYSWALVTDPSRISGFVLARAAALDADTWQQVRAAIAAAGQNSCLYLTSPTTGGDSRIVPLCAG
ncbi:MULTISPECIES: lipocalin family protein [Nocardia]|uniref:lipocalin family protein n=1 Tax=Nocardia TaxID=1817 RepID=UPI00237E32F9|nr:MULTISPECIES: lipocalin family protein [Nocardia]MDE1669860.1 lipocalin family protein [Nocardia gipuzkoensis]